MDDASQACEQICGVKILMSKIHHQTVLNHLKKAGFKGKLDVWVPHELSAKNKMDIFEYSPKFKELSWKVLITDVELLVRKYFLTPL